MSKCEYLRGSFAPLQKGGEGKVWRDFLLIGLLVHRWTANNSNITFEYKDIKLVLLSARFCY